MLPSPDPRQEVYTDLHSGQMQRQEEQNRHAAECILKQWLDLVPSRSLLDVGCGLGTWMKAAQNLGVADVFGIEGPWLDASKVVTSPELVRAMDLEKSFDLGRRFDVAVCLEVAEHLSATAAPAFVESLVRHSDFVLFSAAIPGQGGHHHVNEQFPDYWAEFFARHDYLPVDLFRPPLWKDDSILWWLRQNLLLFASRKALAGHPHLGASPQGSILSMVHPAVYLGRIQAGQQAQQQLDALVNLIGQGGLFRATRLPSGEVNLQRVQ